MPNTVIVNNLTVVHKQTNGVSFAFPDVCKTPAPPAPPVPIPYPNVARSSDAAECAQTVTADGNPLMHKGSYFSTSTGDEAGSAQGVVSNKIKGKAYPKMYSFDVKVEGQNVFRFSDIMLQNGGSPTNTPPAAEMQANMLALGNSQTKDLSEAEVTRLKWSKTEAICGDKVQLSLQTRKVDGELSLPVRVHRAEDLKAVLANIHPKVKGNKSQEDWIVVRGPYKKTVRARARQSLLKGKEITNQTLEIKAPEAFRQMVGPFQRLTPQYVRQNIGGSLVWTPTGVNYGWEVCYEIELKEGELVITRKIDFQLIGGATLSAKKKRNWKREIETVWNRKFKLHREKCKRGDRCTCSSKNGCCAWSIRIVCEFGPGQGMKTELHKGTNQASGWGTALWWYSHTWWEGASGVPTTVRAHEFGHQIGMYDEYPEGACDPARQYTNVPSSIMNAGSKLYPRHMKEFHDWFDTKAKSLVGKTKLVRL
ncbi:hypothetical protein CYFUS_006515 [Cystobacter fuscus]|uniref:Uncharacterized protein n=1 Tax=Cystobacter fuscus TaxID=43 RepID=A0A250JBS9_9BACT|nr:hypothetical protein CYFUS_006515 [Cystobacter fuscus]